MKEDINGYTRAIELELERLGVPPNRRPGKVGVVALAMDLEEQRIEIGTVGITCAVIGFLAGRGIKVGGR